MNRLYKLTLLSIVLSVCLFYFKKRQETTVAMGEGLVIPKEWLITTKHPLTPAKDVRPADQTFLTYPEWFLVFSPEEQANYFKQHTASTLSFKSHTRQIWESYRAVVNEMGDAFPPNPGYHLMIWVIGVSSTVEYLVKSGYEAVVGRLTDTSQSLSAEDQLNAAEMERYVAFIKDRPWYEFDFSTSLTRLWRDTPFWGSYPIRKLERRYWLTSEWIVKYGYGKLIGVGTGQVYEAALPTTVVLNQQDSLQQFPRYDRFVGAANAHINNGGSFHEIAGNSTVILVCAVVDEKTAFQPSRARLLFQQPVPTMPGQFRVLWGIPVQELHILLQEAGAAGIAIEHIFDF